MQESTNEQEYVSLAVQTKTVIPTAHVHVHIKHNYVAKCNNAYSTPCMYKRLQRLFAKSIANIEKPQFKFMEYD